jgi:hypothetical protein
VGALGVIVAADLGLKPVPLRGAGEAAAEPNDPSLASQQVFLTAALSPGMHVTVDGKAVEVMIRPDGGVIEVAPGARKVEVRAKNGPLWSARLDLGGDTPDTLHPVLGGEIVIEADRAAPRGVLFVDDALAGAAPATITEITPGWHTISVRDGQEILYEDACVVSAGRVTLVSIPARPAHGNGSLAIRSRVLGEDGLEEVSGDRIWLDGAAVGSTPWNRLLPSGFHSVRVERAGFPAFVQVLYLEAGRSMFVDAQFGGAEPIVVTADPPAETSYKTPLAIPVSIGAEGESVTLTEGSLFLVRGGQPTTVSVPLVASGTDARLWVAVVPAELTGRRGPLSGYVACTDEQGRRGTSDIFQITVR